MNRLREIALRHPRLDRRASAQWPSTRYDGYGNDLPPVSRFAYFGAPQDR
ncbi:hypothetical protein [Nocardia altamirensis]|nr:hypothetical protein [Nocardia altamirensis]